MQVKTSDISIRMAQKEDAKHILRLVKELAEYEKAADQVITSVAEYEYMIESQKVACLLAEQKDSVIGIALYYETFSTWRGLMYYLEDLVVMESYRRQGIGQLLIDGFIEKAKEANASMVKWQVLDWNEPAIKFYEQMGAAISKEWYNVTMRFK